MKPFALLPHTQVFSLLFRLGVLASTMLVGPPAAHAGCGCTKPAPPPAAVRPNVTDGGRPVTLFHPSLVTGGSYTVQFTALDGSSASVSATAVNSRTDKPAVQHATRVDRIQTDVGLHCGAHGIP